MNSKQLKNQYKETYEKFFQENEIVVSAPFLMTRAGDLSPEYSGVTIKQKIPLRLYLGVNKNNSNKISLNDITYFDKSSESFIDRDILEYAPHFYQLSEHINKERKGIIDTKGGFDINILSELPRGAGLGFESIISFLLSTILNRVDGVIDHNYIKEINKIGLQETLEKSDINVKKRFTDGIIFDKLIFGTVISGVKKSSLFDSYYPIVSMSKDYKSTDNDSLLSLNKSYTFRFNELFKNLEIMPCFPVDYGIIYSGKPMLLEQILTRNKKDSIYLNGIKPDLKKVFTPHFKGIADDLIPKFYKNFILPENTISEDILYGNIMGLISIKVLYYMTKLYASEYNEDNVRSFIDALKRYRWGDYITKESSSDFIEIVKRLTENCNILSKLIAFFPNDTTIMGGTIGFALPLEGYRTSIKFSIDQTKKEYPGVDLLYASWIDGNEHEGLKFEQDIDHSLFSEFIDSKKYTLKTVNGANILGEYNDLLNINDHDIVLDCINKKFYIKGKKVTSEDIHSQSTTIEILQILFENIGRDVHCKEFPLSSYSKNKNEMLGKIIMPLIRLTKKELRKDFPLICKGMIYDFYLKFNTTDIKIGLLEKLNKF